MKKEAKVFEVNTLARDYRVLTKTLEATRQEIDHLTAMLENKSQEIKRLREKLKGKV